MHFVPFIEWPEYRDLEGTHRSFIERLKSGITLRINGRRPKSSLRYLIHTTNPTIAFYVTAQSQTLLRPLKGDFSVVERHLWEKLVCEGSLGWREVMPTQAIWTKLLFQEHDVPQKVKEFRSDARDSGFPTTEVNRGPPSSSYGYMWQVPIK